MNISYVCLMLLDVYHTCITRRPVHPGSLTVITRGRRGRALTGFIPRRCRRGTGRCRRRGRLGPWVPAFGGAGLGRLGEWRPPGPSRLFLFRSILLWFPPVRGYRILSCILHSCVFFLHSCDLCRLSYILHFFASLSFLSSRIQFFFLHFA